MRYLDTAELDRHRGPQNGVQPPSHLDLAKDGPLPWQLEAYVEAGLVLLRTCGEIVIISPNVGLTIKIPPGPKRPACHLTGAPLTHFLNNLPGKDGCSNHI